MRGWFEARDSTEPVVLHTTRGNLTLGVVSYAGAPVILSEVLNLISGPFKDASDHAAVLIGARLPACQEVIAK